MLNGLRDFQSSASPPERTFDAGIKSEKICEKMRKNGEKLSPFSKLTLC